MQTTELFQPLSGERGRVLGTSPKEAGSEDGRERLGGEVVARNVVEERGWK